MTSTTKINKCYQKKLKKCLVLHIAVLLWMYKPGISAGAKCGRPGRTTFNTYRPLEDAFNEGDTIQYTCTEKDHVILGSSERRCQRNGTWSDDIPVCSKLARIENIELLSQDFEIENFNSIDGNISTCAEAPKYNETIWRGYLPASINISAVQITLLGIRKADITVIIQDETSFIAKRCTLKTDTPEVIVKSTVTLTFYCPDSTMGKYVHVTCSNQALKICEVSVLLPQVPSFIDHHRSPCLSPDIPLHGSGYKRSNGTHSVYKFECNNGYAIGGELLVTCQPDGRWSPKSPICGEIFCFPPSELENGYVEHDSRNGRVPYNGNARYKCNEGFYMDGPSEITCHRPDQWNFPPPVCIQRANTFRTTEEVPVKETLRHSNDIHCGNLPHVANGVLISNSSSVGSTALLKCSEGFKPLAFDHVSCLSTGEWSSQSVHCAIIQCEANPTIPYGKAILLDNSFYYGAFLEIKCNEGYTSHTRITRKCNELGTWGNLDVCVEITCGTFSASEDTNKWLPVNGSAHIRVLICPEDYHIEGSPAVVRCLSNGSWSYTSAKCAKSFADFWGSSWSPSFMLVAAIGAGAGTAILILCLSVAFVVMKKRRQSQTNTTIFHLENVSHKNGTKINKHRQSHLSEVENYRNEIEHWSQSSCTNPRKSHSPLPNLPVDADPVYAQPFEAATASKKTLVVTANKKDDLYNNHIYAEPVDSRKQTPAHTPINLNLSQIGNDGRLSAIKTNFIYESPPLVQTERDQQNCDKKCAIYDSSSSSTLISGQLANDEKKCNENTEFNSLTYNLEYLELL